MRPRKLILVAAAIVSVATLVNAQHDAELGERACSGLHSAERASCAQLTIKLRRLDRLVFGVNTLIDEMFETQSEIVSDRYLRIAIERGDDLTRESKSMQRQLSEAMDAQERLDRTINDQLCVIAEMDRRSCDCFDGRDNDGDGKVDRDDPECYESGRFVPTRTEHES